MIEIHHTTSRDNGDSGGNDIQGLVVSRRVALFFGTDEEAQANARLFVAAPKLLEACKLALGAFESNNCIDWGELESAIAKAEGKL